MKPYASNQNISNVLGGCAQAWKHGYINVYTIPEIPKPITIAKPRKRGRPAGSKNKKTLEKEAAIEAMILSGIDPSQINPKKPNGRPKGSKDTAPRKRRTKAEIESARRSS